MKTINKISATFTIFSFGSNWVAGNVGEYFFEAKLFDYGSEYGINSGRVSKLTIYERGNAFPGLVNYDRGWDIKPNKKMQPYYNAVMALCESAPSRFDLTESFN